VAVGHTGDKSLIGVFSKTGGTIIGYASDKTNGNVVTYNSGEVRDGKGHAVAGYKDDVHKFKDTTVGPTDNMSYNAATGAWNVPRETLGLVLQIGIALFLLLISGTPILRIIGFWPTVIFFGMFSLALGIISWILRRGANGLWAWLIIGIMAIIYSIAVPYGFFSTLFLSVIFSIPGAIMVLKEVL